MGLGSHEFIYGLISGVVATLVGFLFAVMWDLWKERRRSSKERRKSVRLLRQEIGVNIQILDANCDVLESDSEAAKERKEFAETVSLLHTQIWESTRLAGALAILAPEFLKELDVTYVRTLMLNQRIEGRELYRLTNQAMSDYAARRDFINQGLLAHTKALLSRFGKLARDLEPSDVTRGKGAMTTENPNSPGLHESTPRWKRILEMIAVGAGVFYAIVAYWQWHEMHRALLVDQRAWISVAIPTNFPLEGTSILAPLQIANTGKTPAKDVEGDIIATVLKKGVEPVFDFSLGHPHNRLYAGAVFPNAPIPTTVPIVRYGPMVPEPIVPTPELRQEIAGGQSFIILYGKITYADIFGVQHWTAFCTGSGPAIQTSDLKKCISYNDIDSN
jgi:hypothetical protein